jgi:hypothetical protein
MDIDRLLPVVINSAYYAHDENFPAWTAEAHVMKSSDLTELKEKVRRAVAKSPGYREPAIASSYGEADLAETAVEMPASRL